MVAIATELATAYISLVPSFKGGTRAIEKELGGVGATAGKTAGKGFGSAFGKAASLAVPLLAGAAILGQVKDVFAAASESRKIAALTEQVIKTTGGAAKLTADQVADLSGALAKKTGVDDEVIQSGANLLLTFKNVRNEAGKGNDIFTQTTELANDMSVALGQDMTSSSLQLGKALNDPIKGLTALTRAGVSFTQEQKDQVKAMVASGDLLGAQKLILAEVGDQFGGAAEAAATPMDKLKVIAGDLQEQLGEKLLPVVDNVATWLGENLPSMLTKAEDGFRRVWDVVSGVYSFIKDDVIPGIQDTIARFTGGFTGEDESGFFGQLGAKAREVRDFVVDVAIPNIMTAVDDVTAGWTGEDTNGVFGFIGNAAREARDFIVDVAMPNITDAVSDLGKGAAGTAGTDDGGFFSGIGNAARGAHDFITRTAGPGIKDVIGSFAAGFSGQGGEGSLFTDLGEAAAAAVKLFKEYVVPYVEDTVLPLLRRIADFIRDNLKPILIGLGVAILVVLGPVALLVAAFILAYQKSELFRDIVAGVFEVVKFTITNSIDAVMGIFAGLIWFFDTVLMPIFTKLRDVAGDEFDRIKAKIGAVVEAVKTVVSTGFEIVKNLLTDPVLAAKDKVSEILDGITTLFTDLPGKLKAGLSTLAETIAAPFKAMGQAIKDAWNDSIGGKGIDIPDIKGLPNRGERFEIPTLHSGGIVPGRPGTEVLRILEAGELVSSRAQVAAMKANGQTWSPGVGVAGTGGGQTINVATVANANAAEVVEAINAKLGWAHTARRDR